MQRILLVGMVLVSAGLARGGEISSVRPAATFSIVARDPATGELGVAVQSHWFSVGSSVSWAEAGVGAVATQSFIEPGYGPRGLKLMQSGESPQSSLEKLLARDPNRDVRQVAFIDAEGNTAVYTGKMCIPAAGHKQGDNYSVQGNLLDSPRVWEEMARAFEQAQGSLADRILQALEAGQAAGGDVRGRQSAALVVVKVVSKDEPWLNRIVDLRVDDHPEPIKELRRLLDLRKAYDLANQGDGFLANQDFENAFKAYNAALEIVPDNDELLFWRGAMLMQSGRRSEALADIRRAVELNPRWLKLLERIQPEHFPGAREVLESVR
jgi:uncharacterized Ntn-hydrolase superfamily protein